MRTALAVVAALAMVLGTAGAETLALVKAADPIPHSYPGRDLSVLDMKLGMSPTEIGATIKNLGYEDPTLTVGRETVSAKGFQLTSADHPTMYDNSKNQGSDRVQVSFASPALGGGAVTLYRKADLGNGARPPATKDLIDQLMAKYGPTVVPPLNAGIITITWPIGAGGKTFSCGIHGCVDASYITEPSSLAFFRNIAQLGAEVYVQAKVTPYGNDPSRVAAIEITVEDIQNQIRSIEEMAKQMQAEIDRLDKGAARQPTKL